MFLPCCSLSDGRDFEDCAWLALDSFVSFRLSSPDVHLLILSSLCDVWLLALAVDEPLSLLLLSFPKTGTILTTSGLSAGSDAHTIARLASIALQYAVGAL